MRRLGLDPVAHRFRYLFGSYSVFDHGLQGLLQGMVFFGKLLDPRFQAWFTLPDRVHVAAYFLETEVAVNVLTRCVQPSGHSGPVLG